MKQKKPIKMTAAKLLVEQGLSLTLKEASAYICAGRVIADQQRVDKPGQWLRRDSVLKLKKAPFLSRGGQKLQSAITELGLVEKFKDKVVLDVGASTGGFTDCVLKLGAQHVIAVDVGFNQLAWSLRTDAKVTSLEKTDIRNFSPVSFPHIDWVLADISFQSLESLAADLIRVGRHSQFLILIKPQFELRPEEIPTGGVVTQQELWEKAIEKVKAAVVALGAQNLKIAKSGLKGREGNQEFFLYFELADSLSTSELSLATRTGAT